MTNKIVEDSVYNPLGLKLKEAREKLGFTKKDIASKTKISLYQVECLEEGNFETLPPVFIKGFLRSYSAELGLDYEEILEEYSRIANVKNKGSSKQSLQSKYVESDLIAKKNGSYGIWLVIFIFICIALGAAYYFKLFDSSDSSANRTQIDANVEVSETVSDIVAVEQNPPVANQENTNTANAVVTAETQPEVNVLVLVSSKEDWGNIIIDDRPVKRLHLKPNEPQTFNVLKNAKVTVGNGSTSHATWNGTDMGALGSASRTATVIFPR